MSRIGKVKVFDNSISRMFVNGGEVAEFTEYVTEEIEFFAQRTAPRRSGELSSKHFKNYLNNGRFKGRGFVGNSAKHATFVHDGVVGPIYPKGEFLLIPSKRGGLPKRLGGKNIMKVSMVKGQKPQPWLRRAARVVLAKHGLRIP